jgi:hypothetical protein
MMHSPILFIVALAIGILTFAQVVAYIMKAKNPTNATLNKVLIIIR